jgi:hypothetical protein
MVMKELTTMKEQRRKRRKDQGEEEEWKRCGETCERRKTKERMRARRKVERSVWRKQGVDVL